MASISSIGIPREIKRDEKRVALTPDGVRELVSVGLEVRVEHGAGAGADRRVARHDDPARR